MGSFISAPPRDVVYEVSAVYGSLMGAFSLAKTRLWLLLADGDPDRPIARICHNDGQTGMPVWTDLGPVESATSRAGRLEFKLVDGAEFTLVEAPCVCGAGAAGQAGPVPDRYEISRVRTDTLSWLTIL